MVYHSKLNMIDFYLDLLIYWKNASKNAKNKYHKQFCKKQIKRLKKLIKKDIN